MFGDLWTTTPQNKNHGSTNRQGGPERYHYVKYQTCLVLHVLAQLRVPKILTMARPTARVYQKGTIMCSRVHV